VTPFGELFGGRLEAFSIFFESAPTLRAARILIS
jgi:hypothetical protein